MDVKKLMEEMNRYKAMIQQPGLTEAQEALRKIKSMNNPPGSLTESETLINHYKSQVANDISSQGTVGQMQDQMLEMRNKIFGDFDNQLLQQRQEIIERITGSPKASFVVDRFQEEMRKMLEPLDNPVADAFNKLKNSINANYEDLQQSNREIYLTPEPTYITEALKLPKFEPRDFAAEWLAAYEEEVKERRENLPEGKTLRVYIAFGSREILISDFNLKDNRSIEIKGFDGQNLVSVISEYDKIQLMFIEMDLPPADKDEVIH